MTMDSRLRAHIDETIGGCAWTPITNVIWEDGKTPWLLSLFDENVDFEGRLYRCIILKKIVYDPDDLTAVDYAEDILAQAWET